MRRLLTHLAQFSSFSKQGEVLCTRGLEYLLENPQARASLAAHISAKTGVMLSEPHSWRAEIRQVDGGRPDLEAIAADGRPLAKVEAKLGAILDEGQLCSYAADLQGRGGGGLLLVVVPRTRMDEAESVAASAFSVDKKNCAIAVTSWEDVLETLTGVSDRHFTGDLAQVNAMYNVLIGRDIETPHSKDDLRAWRDREGVYVSLVDRATRRLTRGNKVLPFALEDAVPGGYFRRYVCRSPGSDSPCFSVGTCDSIGTVLTPIWLRFHHGTATFSIIRDRVIASGEAHGLVQSGGHVWLPLDVPVNVEADAVIDAIVARAEAIARVAYGLTS